MTARALALIQERTMAKPKVIEDQYGESWAVYQGDPASGLISQFNSLPLELVVLPRDTIITGELPSAPPEPLDIDFRTALVSVIIRLQRQHDCVQYLLEKEGGHGSTTQEDERQ